MNVFILIQGEWILAWGGGEIPWPVNIVHVYSGRLASVSVRFE